MASNESDEHGVILDVLVISLDEDTAFWAAAPKGSMTCAFTHMGNFLLLLLLLLLFRTIPSPQLPGPYLSLEAHDPILRPKSQS